MSSPNTHNSTSTSPCFLHPTTLPPEILDLILTFLPPPFTPLHPPDPALRASFRQHTISWALTTPPLARPFTTHLYLPLALTCRSFHRYLRPWIYRAVVLVPGYFPYSYALSLLIRSILTDTCGGPGGAVDNGSVAEYIRALEIRGVKGTMKQTWRRRQAGEGQLESGVKLFDLTAHRRGLWKKMGMSEVERRVWTVAELDMLRGVLVAAGGDDGKLGLGLGLSEDAAARVVEQVLAGVPEVLVGILVGLLAKRGRGQLRELRITLPAIEQRGLKPTQQQAGGGAPSDFLWGVLDRIFPPSDTSCTPFPALATVQITATRGFRPDFATYEPRLQPILLPLLRLPALSRLSISVLELEKDPWPSPLPPAPPSAPALQMPLALTHLTLTLARPDTLTALLSSTPLPNLSTLNLRFTLRNSIDYPPDALPSVSYALLGAALHRVRGTLRELGIAFSPPIGSGTRMRGWLWDDPRALGLGECRGLGKVTVALSVLVGPGGRGVVVGPGGGMAGLLPRGLGELVVGGRDVAGWVGATEWERGGGGEGAGNGISMVGVLAQYFRMRGTGTGGGGLRRFAVLRDVDLRDRDDWPAAGPSLSPSERAELERVARECGVECVFDVPRVWLREAEEEMQKE